MRLRTGLVAALVLAVLVTAAPWLAAAPPARPEGPLQIQRASVYRLGVFLVVDALVTNTAGIRADSAQLTVEFYDFFQDLLRVEHASLQPPTLYPGQTAAVRVATPYTDDVRTIRYRLTWWAAGTQFQSGAVLQASWRR